MTPRATWDACSVGSEVYRRRRSEADASRPTSPDRCPTPRAGSGAADGAVPPPEEGADQLRVTRHPRPGVHPHLSPRLRVAQLRSRITVTARDEARELRTT